MKAGDIGTASKARRNEITDKRGRLIDYARISVTDRCNFRCSYCMPDEGVSSLSHEDVMRYEDITFLCSVLYGLGVRKVRFTGGEPLVRKGMVSFLREYRGTFPDAAIYMTTNASMLERHAADLSEVHLSGMNVSLDTINPEKFKKITRVGDIRDVFRGIASSREAGIPNVKTNTVLIKGFNDDELPDILSFAWKNELTPRLIEFMPIGGDIWRGENFKGAAETLAALERFYGKLNPLAAEGLNGLPPSGPAKYYLTPENRVVGVIDAVSNHFCSACNRLRITASGALRACLFSSLERPMMELLRRRDESGLRRAIIEGMSAKPDRWMDELEGVRRMSRIGG